LRSFALTLRLVSFRVCLRVGARRSKTAFPPSSSSTRGATEAAMHRLFCFQHSKASKDATTADEPNKKQIATRVSSKRLAEKSPKMKSDSSRTLWSKVRPSAAQRAANDSYQRNRAGRFLRFAIAESGGPVPARSAPQGPRILHPTPASPQLPPPLWHGLHRSGRTSGSPDFCDSPTRWIGIGKSSAKLPVQQILLEEKALDGSVGVQVGQLDEQLVSKCSCAL